MSQPVLTRDTSFLHDILGLRPADRLPLFKLLIEQDRFKPLLALVNAEFGTPYALWQDDPVGFYRVILRQTPWWLQEEVIRSVEANVRTVVPSCHGTGKTWNAAMAVAWFGSVHRPEDTQIVTTAPRMRQVRTLLWPHIRRVHALAGLPGDTDQTQWKIGKHLLAYGFSAANAPEDALQGIHSPHLLIVVDEGGGIPATIGRAIEAITTGAHTRVLVIGNPPTDNEGSWFEERTQSELWHSIRIGWEDTPNHPDNAARAASVPDAVKAGLVDQRWVDDQITEFGPESTFVVARVHARFPHGSSNQTIPYSWLEDAMDDDHVGDPGDTWVRLGVDVAADGGDELTIGRAEGNTARLVHASSGPQNANATDVAGKVLMAIQDAEALRKAHGEKRPVRVKIDSIGVGWGVASTLESWGKEGIHSAEIVKVNVSEKARDDKKFVNKRAEMWWAGREAVRPRPSSETGGAPLGARVHLDIDKRTATQLHAPKYGHDTQGRIKIEKKADIKKRGLSSPDRAEAVLLALYEPRSHAKGRWGADSLTSTSV